ncbi:hypothetical protein BDD12DRAFT_912475 [Trichophaea hybrida]|nr:hypothetical protein BDD12DRAFT_912475 [Trichophaea hybrida]
MWNEACKEYMEVAGVNILEAEKPRSPDELFALLDKRHHDFDKYRKKKDVLRKVLTLSLKPVQVLSGVAGGAVSSAFPPSACVFGAVTYLIDSANNVSSSYDAIIELFKKLKPFTTLLEIHESLGDVASQYRALVKIFGKVLVVCGQSTRLILEGRIKRYLKAFLLLDSPDVQATLAELDRIIGEEQQLVLAVISSGVVKLDNKVDDLGVKVDVLGQKLDMKFEELKETMLSNIRGKDIPALLCSYTRRKCIFRI